MKTALLYGLLLGAPVLGLLTRVRDRNAAVEAGQAAYARGRSAQAASAFAAALQGRARPTPDPRLVLNLAHAQVRAGQLAAARRSYGRLLVGSPAAVGSVARQQLAVLAAREGEIAQALSLLRQALVLNPANSGARYDFEVLSAYLARQQDPAIPPPGAGPGPKQDKEQAQEKQNGSRAGTDRRGEAPPPTPSPGGPETPPESRPDAAGAPSRQRPAAAPGTAAPGSRGAGTGPSQALPSGAQAGTQRGLDRSGAAGQPAAGGRSNQAGSEAASPEERQLQTQRERLKAMNLSPAQARQVLEALRAQEQQYLQQLARPPARPPDPGKPSW